MAVGGMAFLIAPWIIMSTTGLASNSDAMGAGFFPGGMIMIVCGFWGIANVLLIIGGVASLFSRDSPLRRH